MAMTVFWVAMVVISLVCGLATGNLSQVSQAAAGRGPERRDPLYLHGGDALPYGTGCWRS